MDLKVAVFSVGKWNGIDFTVEDLKLMAASFSALSENHKVPLKFGHNDEQPFTDGQPALGWVKDLSVEGDQLIAEFTDIPDVVFSAIENNLYRHVSVELDMSVEHKGAHYPFVLSGVALLGADIPAVNNIGDLSQFMTRDFESVKRVVFTTIKKPTKEDASMATIEELQAQLDSLRDENTSLKDENLSFERDNKTLKEEKQKAEFSRKKEKIENDLEVLVKDRKILPAQREAFMSQYKDDDTVINMLESNIKVLQMSATQNEEFEQGGNDESEEGSPDVILFERAKKIQSEQKVSFKKATNIAMQADPVLARNYIEMT